MLQSELKMRSGSRSQLTWRRIPRARRLLRSTLVLLTLAPLAASRAAYAEPCTLGRVAELPVTMLGMRPTVHAAINGTDALFIADSGAFFNLLTPAAAEQFKLNVELAPPNFFVSGVGGEARTRLTTVKTFTIFNIVVPKVLFVVAGNDLGNGAVGLLGQNVFRLGDVEYDLANGAIRIIRPKGDCKKSVLAYWANSTGKPYSVIDIDFATAAQPHTTSTAYVNGKKVRVMFDTGASTSVLTLDAAKRAGVTPESAGVTPGGPSHGIGRRVTQSWLAPFASFKVGDEEVRNTQLRIADIALPDVDMLVGADFFLSHRIYVATSQRRLYFTYNGGPVFNLTATPAPATAADSPAAGAADHPQAARDEPTDAAGFARRGAAAAARHDYEHAIADLTRACELAPAEAGYFYERGMAHWGNKSTDLALADFDAAIKLKPDDVPSLLARSSLHAGRQAPPASIVADLDAADRAAPRESDARLRMGQLYASAGDLPGAVTQYTKWIDSHGRDDVQMAAALNSRCWARARLGQDLERALSDCDKAVSLRPHAAAYLDSRGFVYLRRGNYDKALADYDAALRLDPNKPWALYGRGIAKLRRGQTASGQADIAAAGALQPNIAEEAMQYGINP